jgi:predicted phosphodiesterase
MFCGDPHGEFELIRGYGRNADVVILLGDQTPSRPLAEELGPVVDRAWFILGNHDSDSAGYLAAHRGDIWARNLHARVLEFGGIRMASLGGVFRGRVWEPRTEDLRHWSRGEMVAVTPLKKRFIDGLPETHWSSIFPEDFESLCEQAPADLLVCHEAPECHKHGFKVVGDLARALGVRAIVHGHHHRQYQAEIEGGITVFGVGIHGFHIMDAVDFEGTPRRGWKSARRDLLANLSTLKGER